MRYYQILLEAREDTWQLRLPRLINGKSSWIMGFNSSTVAENLDNEIKVEVVVSGNPVDFNFTLDNGVIIVNKKVADLFNEKDVQKIPVSINQQINNQFFILVIKNEFDCIDKRNSKYELRGAGGNFPELEGNYAHFYRLIVDTSKSYDNCQIFRVKDYGIAIIVNEELKEKMENESVSGILYEDATPGSSPLYYRWDF